MAQEAKKEVEVKQEAKPKKSLKKKLTIIIGAAVAVIVALIVIVNTATSAPVKVSNAFIGYLQSGDAGAAYELFTSRAQAATDEEYFEDVVETASEILTGEPDMKSKSVSGETGEAATATVVYQIQGTDAAYVVTVNLQKENGEWKVLNYESDVQ
jgi:hypothetical protein